MNKVLFILFVFVAMVVHAKDCSYNLSNASELKIVSINEECRKIVINLMNGVYKLNSPIVLNLSDVDSISIIGSGIRNTNLMVNNESGGIRLYTNDRDTVVTLKRFSLTANKNNIPFAIQYEQPYGGNQHIRNLQIQDIEISNHNNNRNLFFKTAIDIKGAWRPLLNNVFVSGFFGPKANKLIPSMDTCFNLKDSYSPTISHSRCWSSKIGLNLTSKERPGPEDFIITNSKFVNNLTGINIELASKEPGGYITESHINALEYGIRVKNRKFLIIKNNLFYRHKNSNMYVDISFNSVKYSIVSSNIFHYPKKAKNIKRKEIELINSSNNIIQNNLFTKKSEMVFGNKETNFIKNNYVGK